MKKLDTISFRIENNPSFDAIEVRPIINGVELIELVLGYESAQKFSPAGGYGGIVPDFFSYGPLATYYRGENDIEFWKDMGGIYVLGCDCGEAGCWPLACSSRANNGTITWSQFSQPHRPEWDYSGFGPFVFDEFAFEESTQALNIFETS
jgi:hypothetical protein